MKRSGEALETVAAGEDVTVRLASVSQCSRCAKGQGCGAGIFNQGVAGVELSCSSEQAVTAGDEVMVEFDDDANAGWLSLVLGAYGLPTIGLLSAIVASSLVLDGLWPSESLSLALQDLVLAVAGLTGLAGGVFAWRMIAPGLLRRTEAGRCLQSARIVAVCNTPTTHASALRPWHSVRKETR